jgi:threonine-phosphate decarboxylase
MILLDEAFLDFHLDEERWTQLHQALTKPNWMIIRSLTKFFAIPGVRLGFIVADPELIRKMKKLQVHWSVNHFAQLIGTKVFDERDYIQQTKEWAYAERQWFTSRLRELGFTVIDSSANYLLVQIPEHAPYRVQSLQRMLGERGILIRDASLFDGLDDKYFRLAVRLRSDNQYFLQILFETIDKMTSLGG